MKLIKYFLLLQCLAIYTLDGHSQDGPLMLQSNYFTHIQTMDLEGFMMPYPDSEIHLIGESMCIPDLGDQNIKCYDTTGTLDKIIGNRGRGPGEFTQLAFIDIKSEDSTVVALDMNKRVSFFNYREGIKSSFFISEPHHNLNIAFVGEDKEFLAIAGLPFSPDNYQIDDGHGIVHLYSMDGELIHSFHPPLSFTGDLMGLNAINMDVNVKSGKDGYILVAQPLEYKLTSYDLNGEIKKTIIDGAPQYVKLLDEPTPVEAFNKREIADFWYEEHRHVVDSFFTGSFGYVMVVRTYHPSMYALDIYDQNGTPITVGIQTDSNLRAVFGNTFYFTSFNEENNNYQVHYYQFNASDEYWIDN